MIAWHLDPAHATPATTAAFGSLAAVFALDGEYVAGGPESEMLRVNLDGARYYVKRYFIGTRKLRRRWYGLRDWFGPRRAVREWQNLQRFAAWGIPTATLVAWGQQRHYGRFVRAALVTAELPATVDLAYMARTDDARLRDPRWLRQVLPQIARAARIMHTRGFAHNDLKWRNILVDRAEPPTVYFIDCPAGAFWPRPLLDYRIVKDLACLDKVARRHLRRTARLRFYLDYAQHERLSVADKLILRKVLRFFDGRE